MVQILPQTPSLAELLGSGLGQGISTGMQSILPQLIKERQLQKLSNVLSGNQGMPSEISPEMAGMAEQSSDFDQQPQISQLERIATNPQAMAHLTSINPQMATQIQQMYKNQMSQQKFQFEKEKEMRKRGIIAPETKERLKDVFKRQEELMKKGNIGIGSIGKMLTEKGREDRSEFDELSASIEAALMPLVSKGTLAKERFKYIMSLLPKSSNTIARNKGQIKALKREFGLIEKEIQGHEIKEKEEKETSELQIGQKATNPKTGEKIEWTGTNWRKIK